MVGIFKNVILAGALLFFFGPTERSEGQQQDVAGDHSQEYLSYCKSLHTYACAMLVESVIDQQSTGLAGSAQDWHLHSFSKKLGVHRQDANPLSVVWRGKENAYVPFNVQTLFVRGIEIVQYDGSRKINYHTDLRKPDDAARLVSQVYYEPMPVALQGFYLFNERNPTAIKQFSLGEAIGKWTLLKTSVDHDRITQEYKIHPDHAVVASVIFDKRYGSMPVSYVDEDRRDGVNSVRQRINTSWKQYQDRWFPHETTIELLLGRSEARTKKSWTLKYYWVIDGIPDEVFDPGAVPMPKLRELIVNAAVNRQR